MNKTIAAENRVQDIMSQLAARGVTVGGATKRHFARLTYTARCLDLADIHEEAMTGKAKTWGDI